MPPAERPSTTRAPAAYKALCVDAVDPVRLGSFWAATLDLELRRRDDGPVLLAGPTPQATVWVNQVPEPVTVKQRVHLDVHAGSVQEVLDRGATAVDLESFGWRVVRDPEGGELCVFERTEVPAQRLYEVGVDAVDPTAIARWWAEVLGGRCADGADGADGDVCDASDGGEWTAVEEIPGAPFESLVFARVPEPKTVKNRIHWDVDVADVAELAARGARVLREPDDEISWTVLADPEGNEFCAFTA